MWPRAADNTHTPSFFHIINYRTRPLCKNLTSGVTCHWYFYSAQIPGRTAADQGHVPTNTCHRFSRYIGKAIFTWGCWWWQQNANANYICSHCNFSVSIYGKLDAISRVKWIKLPWMRVAKYNCGAFSIFKNNSIPPGWNNHSSDLLTQDLILFWFVIKSSVHNLLFIINSGIIYVIPSAVFIHLEQYFLIGTLKRDDFWKKKNSYILKSTFTPRLFIGLNCVKIHHICINKIRLGWLRKKLNCYFIIHGWMCSF